MKITIKKLIIILTVILSAIQIQAASNGKFLKYTQLTDKEVLVESTRGVKVLFSAYDHHSIGMTYYNRNETITVILPADIFSHVELNGSIYVEELDEMMQITTAADDGLVIKIDKQKFGFTFIDKTNQQEILLEENLLSQVVSNNKILIVSTDSLGLHSAIQNSSL